MNLQGTIFLVFIIISILVGLGLFVYFKFFSMPDFTTINFVDGAPGVGKTQFCVYWSIRSQNKEKRKRKFLNFFSKIFKKPQKEMPYLYSNIKLRDTKFVLADKDLFTRKIHRCGLNSTLLVDEFSLVADQNVFGKDNKDVCEQMRDFWKLCRHEGFKRIFVNSQNIASVNYTLKDCLGSYTYIHSRIRMPFFSVLKFRVITYSRDASSALVNDTSGADAESNLRYMIIPNKVFKKYDSRCYSVFTDMLPVYDDEIIISGRKKSLKQKNLVSFMQLNELYKNLDNKEEE